MLRRRTVTALCAALLSLAAPTAALAQEERTSSPTSPSNLLWLRALGVVIPAGRRLQSLPGG
jgi:hypothetical protein